MNQIIAILPADVGFNIIFLAVIYVAAVAITIVAAAAVLWSTKHPDEEDKHSLAKYERHWVVISVLLLVLFSVVTASYLPYPYTKSAKPNMVVDVQAQQFAWCLAPSPNWGPPNCQASMKIPVGDVVLFQVRSIDVTHGFGVYQYNPNGSDPFGQILFQVQVMPGFNNSVEYQFSQTGTYYVRCLEYCGYGHYTMISQFNVTA